MDAEMFKNFKFSVHPLFPRRLRVIGPCKTDAPLYTNFIGVGYM